MDMLTSTITAAKRVILSVGSGDGSQQAAIVKSGHHNIVSTFFDNEQAVIAKYGKAREHITLLRDKSTVLFEVDATELHSHPRLTKKKFMLSSSRSLTREYPTLHVGTAVQIQSALKATSNSFVTF